MVGIVDMLYVFTNSIALCHSATEKVYNISFYWQVLRTMCMRKFTFEILTINNIIMIMDERDELRFGFKVVD